MGFLDWLTGRPPFNRFEDSFAMTRASLWAKLKTAISHQQRQGSRVWIVTHFADTFAELQDLLDEWQIEYQICDKEIQPQTALESTRDQSNSVLLILSDLLTLADSTAVAFDDSVAIAMIVVERHPLVEIDHKLAAFSKSMPCRVRFGYYLAIDDMVVRRVVNETTIQILKQLGMKDHELITSNMVTRRLDKVLTREGKQITTNHRADSAEEWYRLNQPAS
jgi:hypothetical protein